MAKSFIPSLLCLSVLFLTILADDFDEKLKNVDVDQILGNDRLVNNYYKCLMDEGPCTPDAAKLKEFLPKAVQSKCGECSEVMKQQAKKAISFLKANKPTYLDNIVAKYDPKEEWKTILN